VGILGVILQQLLSGSQEAITAGAPWQQDCGSSCPWRAAVPGPRARVWRPSTGHGVLPPGRRATHDERGIRGYVLLCCCAA